MKGTVRGDTSHTSQISLGKHKFIKCIVTNYYGHVVAVKYIKANTFSFGITQEFEEAKGG